MIMICGEWCYAPYLGRPTCYGFGAGRAPFGEKFPEALGAVGLVVPACEPLASQRPASGLFPLFFDKKCLILGAVGACEALSVPGVVSISHPACCDHLGMEFV